MSLFNKLLGRGNEHHNSSADYAGSQEQVRPVRHDSQFMQSGRTGYQGGEPVDSYQVPAGSEQQGIAIQTEGVNTPLDYQQNGVNRQGVGAEPVQVFDATETRGSRVQEPVRQEQVMRGEGLEEGAARQRDNVSAVEATSVERPKSPRSPRKEGIGSKMKKIFQSQKYDREQEQLAEGNNVGAHVVGLAAPQYSQTTDNTVTGTPVSTAPTHSASAGGLSPRGNWEPVQGFSFRKSSTPPPHLSRREEKAAIAVAKHDGDLYPTGYETPREQRDNEGGGYDSYGDSVPVTFDVPHSRPGRYASGDQGGAWGDHRASELGSFRGPGMHSPSKERPSTTSERPYWIAPGAQNDAAVAAAAAAGGAAAAKAVTQKRGEFSGERTGSGLEESAGLQGRSGSLPPRDQSNTRYGRSESARESYPDQTGIVSGITTGGSGVINRAEPTSNIQNRSNSRYGRSESARDSYPDQRGAMKIATTSGSGVTNRAEPTSDIRDYYHSVRAQPGETRTLEKEPFGSGQDIGYDNEQGLAQDNVNQRFEDKNLIGRTSSQARRDVGLQTGDQEFGYDNQGSGNQVYANRGSNYQGQNSGSARTTSNVDSVDQSMENLNIRSQNSQGYRNRDITDPQTGAQNYAVGGTTEAETPYQLGERISDQRSRVPGRDQVVERSPGREQSFGVGGATTAHTPYALGEKISDKSWNQERAAGATNNSFDQSGYSNRDVTDPQTGAQNYVVGGRTEAETPYQLGERISDQTSRVRGERQDVERSPTTEQSFGVGGATTARTPYGLGEKISDKAWKEGRASGATDTSFNQSGYDVTDPQTGAQNYVVGGRTEAETPYQLGERISDQRSLSVGRQNVEQLPTTEQSFGVGGATTARTPYDLGEKISDKAWNEGRAAGARSDNLNQTGYGNRDVIDPQTGAQNYVVGGRTEAETPYQLGERISDQRSSVGRQNVERSPTTEHSFGVGGATTARTPYDLGEKISDKAWNEGRVTGAKNDNLNQTGYGNRDIVDPQTSAQNYVVGGRIEAETPYQLGERISHERSRVRGETQNVERSPATEQSFGVGGATTARTPYGLGEKISDKAWNEGRATGVAGNSFNQSGYSNRDVTDPQTGAQNYVVGGRTEAETPYQLGERISDERTSVGRQNVEQSPITEQSFGVGGATTARTPYDLGEKISDKAWNEGRATGVRNDNINQSGYVNRDVTDPQTGAQNYVVGGRTEAETPYQLGERISDERSRVRGETQNVERSPVAEQSFGVGGATTARTPYGLGEKISDKAWNEQRAAGVTGDSFNQSGHSNRDVTDPQTGAQNYVVGGRTEAETPYQLGERISDQRSRMGGPMQNAEQVPTTEQSFGVGGATTARTPYDLGEKISDKAWNEGRATGARSDNLAQSAYGSRDVTDPQTGAQNYVVGGRTAAETPYQLGERISDQRTQVPGYDQMGERSPVTEQSYGVGGATTAHTPYGLGEKISDKSWNESRTTEMNKDGLDRSGLEAGALGASGALGAGAIAVGAGALEANRLQDGTPSTFQRSTVTGEPVMNRQNEIAMGEGRATEAPTAAAAATKHARTEQSDMDSPYVQEEPVGQQTNVGWTYAQPGVAGTATAADVQTPPLSPRSQQYFRHGEPVKSPSLLTTAKYALGRAHDKLTNTGHHLTAGGTNISSVTGVAFGKLDMVAKRMLHGGEHLWRQAFNPPLEEHLRKSFACLLSTESGAVAGVLYQSDHTLWFCSDRALQRAVKVSETNIASPPAYEQYLYKVVLPLAEVAHIEGRTNARSERDKSIKVEMTGGEQFWFFGFLTYEKALINLQHASEVHTLRSASMKAGGA